jgi:hypothetical protein
VLTIEHHTVAVIGVVGSVCNLLGALYLAYDLLGGQHGPLRALTRAVTYSVLFFAGYVIVLPARFSAIAAIGIGATLAVEFSRAARGKRPSLVADAGFSALRGVCFGLGVTLLFGWRFGLAFCVLTTVGQLFAYRMGFTPVLGLQARQHMRKHLLGVANRTIGYALAGVMSGAVAGQQVEGGLLFGFGAGVAIGAVSAIMGFVCPAVERWADQLPLRRLGMFGAFLLCCGFVLDSVEHWLALFDVPILP